MGRGFGALVGLLGCAEGDFVAEGAVVGIAGVGDRVGLLVGLTVGDGVGRPGK